jgi:uncharacterized coiled-coil protein SlyX
MADEADEQGRTRVGRMKDLMSASWSTRHVVQAVLTAFVAGGIWFGLKAEINEKQLGLEAHSGVFKEVKKDLSSHGDRLWTIERQLADGSGPLTIKNQSEDIRDLKASTAEQRRLNGILETQNANTAKAIEKVQDQVEELQKDVGAIKGGVDALVRNLRDRSGPP